jgi:glycosyltransferase involved in cell wall biosynthesis
MQFLSGGSSVGDREPAVDVTIVMPCLNEAKSLPACLKNARDALEMIQQQFGLTGEVLIADNGSTDGSQKLAIDEGARVVSVTARGYGAALIGGLMAARGRSLVMGDADGSYDFRDSVEMVHALIDGADLCMGSRFPNGVRPGAMPWKNRYIGNPLLTGILNLLFQAGIRDAHCGLRALTRNCFDRLNLRGLGMEFASEMVIKAALKGERIVERPATLSPDLRGRPPHLRPWRDGWRHLRYLLMLSPTWVFAAPAVALGVISSLVFMIASCMALLGRSQETMFGNYWIILAGAMLGLSHISGLFAVATHLYGVREGYRKSNAWSLRLASWVCLESMLAVGLVFIAGGLLTLFIVVSYWSAHAYEPIRSVLPAVLGTLLITLGTQNAFGGFLLAILSGNEASFLKKIGMQSHELTKGPAETTAWILARDPNQPDSLQRNNSIVRTAA